MYSKLNFNLASDFLLHDMWEDVHAWGRKIQGIKHTTKNYQLVFDETETENSSGMTKYWVEILGCLIILKALILIELTRR